MNKLLIALFASALIPGISIAQTSEAGRSGSASNPTRTETNVIGPQDSIGTSGASPTKNELYQERNDDSDVQRERSEGSSAAPGTFETGNASDPTKTETNVIGPQDSIGTSGASPTKNELYQERNDDSDVQRERSEGSSAAPGTFATGGTTNVYESGTSLHTPESSTSPDINAEQESNRREQGTDSSGGGSVDQKDPMTKKDC